MPAGRQGAQRRAAQHPGTAESNRDSSLAKKIKLSPVKSLANPLVTQAPACVLMHTVLFPCCASHQPETRLPQYGDESSGWCLENAGYSFLGWVSW